MYKINVHNKKDTTALDERGPTPTIFLSVYCVNTLLLYRITLFVKIYLKTIDTFSKSKTTSIILINFVSGQQMDYYFTQIVSSCVSSRSFTRSFFPLLK